MESVEFASPAPVGGSSVSVTAIREPSGVLQAAVVLIVTKSH